MIYNFSLFFCHLKMMDDKLLIYVSKDYVELIEWCRNN